MPNFGRCELCGSDMCPGGDCAESAPDGRGEAVRKMTAQENWKRQQEGARAFEEQMRSRLPEFISKIEALGGTVSVIHDSISVDMPPGKETEGLDLMYQYWGM